MPDLIDPPTEADATKVAASPPTVTKILAGIEQTVGPHPALSVATARITALEAELAASVASLAAAAETITSLTTERDTARAELATALTAVTDFEARVRARSVEDCASVGVPVAGLPVAGGIGEGGAPTTTEELNKALEGKSFQEKRAILKAWRERDKPAQN